MIEARVHHYAERQYVVLRRYATHRQAMNEEGGEITSVYRVTPEGTLTRIVRWPRELGGGGGGARHGPAKAP